MAALQTVAFTIFLRTTLTTVCTTVQTVITEPVMQLQRSATTEKNKESVCLETKLRNSRSDRCEISHTDIYQ